MANDSHSWIPGRAQALGLFALDLLNLALDELHALVLPLEAGDEPGGEGGAVPGAGHLQAFGEVFGDRQVDTLGGEQAFDAVDVGGALVGKGPALAVEMAPLFSFDVWHVDDAPDVLLADVVAHQHAEQLGKVHLIGLEPSAALLDFELAASTTRFSIPWAIRYR
jgi:hypothetical protein